MKSLCAIVPILMFSACTDETTTNAERTRIIYQSGDLLIKEGIVSDNQKIISIKCGNDILGIYRQVLTDGKYRTFSSMAGSSMGLYMSYYDEDSDGIFDGLYIHDPRDMDVITIFDVTPEGVATLASPEKHEKLEEMNQVFQDFFTDLFTDPDAKKNLNEKIQATQDQINKIQSEQSAAEESPTRSDSPFYHDQNP